ncbi:MAG: MBL fold metallo-hydrolase [Moraxella sp.]|nr:MBL fold metallo-hydrolase [Moraxella sp.]
MSILLTVLKYLVGLVMASVVAMLGFLKLSPVFGGTADTITLAHMAKMTTFKNGKFDNLEPIIVDGSGAGVSDDERLTLMDFIINILNPADGKHPKEPLPTLALSDNLPKSNHRFTWLGHSTVLFKMGDKTLITDPVFYQVSPIFVGGSPYKMTHLPATHDLPNIDVVLISHDHYDHLDMKAIKDIHQRVGQFVVPLGIKAHLVRWGVEANKVREFAWHDTHQIDNLTVSFVPARHYGGRSFDTKNMTLWGGWVVKSPDFSLYYTGDGGYGKHFADIGQRYAPDDGFDLMLVENGAYNINWADVHMTPEQSVQAVKDARAKVALPVHWGKYDLAYHSWREPAERFVAEADKQGVSHITPQIGQSFGINDRFGRWWETVK